MRALQLPPIQSPLLKWFRETKRDLPWRRTSDPYAVWVSEIMLQQTQVKTVIPYYERWMKRFPTVKALASASLSRVLKAWEGLGYYSRARNLHRAARLIEQDLGGKFPDSREMLERLPGIGRYTAGAIASIAFNQPEAVLDGNVKRVLARLLALKEAVDTSHGEKKLWAIAQALVVGAGSPRPSTRARKPRPYTWIGPPINGRTHRSAPTDAPSKSAFGDFNQALMELGAVVCLPDNPRCTVCPVKNFCKAHRLKRETGFPVKYRRQKLERLRTVAAVIWKGRKVLVERQPLKARWGGLWAFPHWVYSNGKEEPEFLKEKVRRDLGIRISEWRRQSEIRHGFTKYDVRLKVFEGVIHNGRGGVSPPVKMGAGTAPLQSWVDPKRLLRLPLPRPHQKIADLLRSHA